jgi:two-component system, sensor histidine kinase and response regulator
MVDVLVVDDNRDCCTALVRLVSHLGGAADWVLSGAAAIQYVLKQPPKLVFLDWMMPEMDGLGVLCALRSTPALRDLPVIVFSAACQPSVKQAALKAGAQGFIVKGNFQQI